MRIFYVSSHSYDGKTYLTIRCEIFGYTLFTFKRCRKSKPEDWMESSTCQTIKDLLYLY